MRGLLQFPEDTPGVQDVLTRVAEQDLSVANFQPPNPCRMSGCRHLPEAITAGLIVSADLCHALATVEDQLCWHNSAGYTDEALQQPGFMENCAAAEIIGDHGFFRGDDFRLGVMLIGPNLHYIDHRHAAPELYWLLTGPIEYSREGGTFETVGTADTIWNEANEVHSMRTGSRPMLAVWAWTNDVDQLPELMPAA